jgi:hypothetical protein
VCSAVVALGVKRLFRRFFQKGRPHHPCEPQHVAEVLAELMKGQCVPFGPLEGAFMAASGDTNGTTIEVYPERTALDMPDRDDLASLGVIEMFVE